MKKNTSLILIIGMFLFGVTQAFISVKGMLATTRDNPFSGILFLMVAPIFILAMSLILVLKKANHCSKLSSFSIIVTVPIFIVASYFPIGLFELPKYLLYSSLEFINIVITFLKPLLNPIYIFNFVGLVMLMVGSVDVLVNLKKGKVTD